MSSPEQNAWVQRVLGCRIETSDPTATAGAGSFAEALAAWRDASETVDSQIESLAKVLRETGDEDLIDIAEFGLSAVTDDHKVPLMAALMDLGDGTPETIAKGGAKALTMIQAFQAHIETDERVAACENNPAGVVVSIRATLGPPLGRLAASLA
jgi:hypothetical protein